LNASYIVIDKLHYAGDKDTMTYTHIVDPHSNIHPNNQSGFLAITGSLLDNGVNTALTWAMMALEHSDDEGELQDSVAVKLWKEADLYKMISTLNKFKKKIEAEQISVQQALEQDMSMRAMSHAHPHPFSSDEDLPLAQRQRRI
jgi:hypothetical protein